MLGTLTQWKPFNFTFVFGWFFVRTDPEADLPGGGGGGGAPGAPGGGGGGGGAPPSKQNEKRNYILP